jgi:hypothetical protein
MQILRPSKSIIYLQFDLTTDEADIIVFLI